MVIVRRIEAGEGPTLRSTRLAALADAPGDSTTTLARAESRDVDHWATSAAANASGPLQATFFAGIEASDEPVGMVGAYANRDRVVNVVGLWAASGHRDVGIAPTLLGAVKRWATANGARLLRIWVVERNEYARSFYEGEGFRPTGSAMPYEPEPRIRQVEMTLQL